MRTNYVAVQHSSTLFMNKWSGTGILTGALGPVIGRYATRLEDLTRSPHAARLASQYPV